MISKLVIVLLQYYIYSFDLHSRLYYNLLCVLSPYYQLMDDQRVRIAPWIESTQVRVLVHLRAGWHSDHFDFRT